MIAAYLIFRAPICRPKVDTLKTSLVWCDSESHSDKSASAFARIRPWLTSELYFNNAILKLYLRHNREPAFITRTFRRCIYNTQSFPSFIGSRFGFYVYEL